MLKSSARNDFCAGFLRDFIRYFSLVFGCFLYWCDTCDSKKTTSLLEGARIYAREGSKWEYKKTGIREGRDMRRRKEESWKVLLHTDIDIWRNQNTYYLKLECHFSAIFSLFDAISSHISIGGWCTSKIELNVFCLLRNIAILFVLRHCFDIVF